MCYLSAVTLDSVLLKVNNVIYCIFEIVYLPCCLGTDDE